MFGMLSVCSRKCIWWKEKKERLYTKTKIYMCSIKLGIILFVANAKGVFGITWCGHIVHCLATHHWQLQFGFVCAQFLTVSHYFTNRAEHSNMYTLAMVAHADGVGIKLSILCGSRDGPHQINAAQLKLLMGILCRHHILLDYITASWDATHWRLFSLARSFWDRQFIGWKIGGIFGRTHNF